MATNVMMNRKAVLADNPFKKAVRQRVSIKLALVGMPGTGKTYTAMLLASQIGGKVAVLDSERGSASLYAKQFDFDVVALDGDYHPDQYINAILAAEAHGYATIIIDSLSHPWSGEGGILSLKDKMPGKDSFKKWAQVTPIHNALVDAILSAKVNVFATLRGKPLVGDKDVEPIFANLGIVPDQRDGILHEFDVVGVMDHSNMTHIAKSRVDALNNLDKIAPAGLDAKGAKVTRYSDLAQRLKAWANEGADPALFAWHDRAAVEAFFKREAVAKYRTPTESVPDLAVRVFKALGVSRASDLAGVMTMDEAAERLTDKLTPIESAPLFLDGEPGEDDTPPPDAGQLPMGEEDNLSAYA